jgi:hypothetical protein
MDEKTKQIGHNGKDEATERSENSGQVVTSPSNTDTIVNVTQDRPRPSKFVEYFDALLFACIVALFLKIFIVEAYRIPTGSMEETLLVGDFLLVNKFIYGATTPRNVPFTEIRMPFLQIPSADNSKER